MKIAVSDFPLDCFEIVIVVVVSMSVLHFVLFACLALTISCVVIAS